MPSSPIEPFSPVTIEPAALGSHKLSDNVRRKTCNVVWEKSALRYKTNSSDYGSQKVLVPSCNDFTLGKPRTFAATGIFPNCSVNAETVLP